MADRPILFSATMVQALLAGRKTQTRRALYSLRAVKNGLVPKTVAVARGVDKNGVQFAYKYPRTHGLGHYYAVSPWFSAKKGDRLWVRESFRFNEGGGIYDAAGGMIDYVEPHFIYQANSKSGPFKPSIHMPRRASRLTLTVAGVRVERLQSISNADAEAEGCKAFGPAPGDPHDGVPIGDAGDAYAALWDDINGVGAWDANPWVVAVTFTVERRNIDA